MTITRTPVISSQWKYRTATSEDAEKIANNLSAFFGASLDVTRDWLSAEGTESYRALVGENGEIAASANLMEMGQYFGGNRVKAAGVAGLGVLPHWRGKGIAGILLKEMLTEMHDRGFCISPLYPATHSIYHRAGWDRAGWWIRWQCDPAKIYLKERTLDVRPCTSADNEAVRAIYEKRARGYSNGNLDRPEYRWRSVLGEEGNDDLQRYIVFENNEPTAYISFRMQGDSTTGKVIDVADYASLTARGGKRLLTLLADHAAQFQYVTWAGGIPDQLGLLLPEDIVKVQRSTEWFLRLVDVREALRQRGWPQGCGVELSMEVHDDVLPWNNTTHRLVLDNGEMSVERTTDPGNARIHVRHLASLYSGHLSARELRFMDALKCDDETEGKLEMIFAGPSSWLGEWF